MSKVDIISGFLGAGKTTLIKKLINEGLKDEKIVLIENEFGEIGIDSSFLKSSGIEITEMNSGCICCSLVGDFSEALKKVVDKYHPDRIIIEPSGVGKLSDVIQAVKNIDDKELQLNSFITVIDAKKCMTYSINFGEFFNNQIEHASSIILSKTQNMDKDELHTCLDIIKQYNEKSNIMTTPWDELTAQIILDAIEDKDSLQTSLIKETNVCPECGHHHEHGHHHHHHHHHHHADEVFTIFSKETVNTYTREQLESILKELSHCDDLGTVLRAKGVLQAPDQSWLHFDFVPGEYEIRVGDADYTGRICVIGHHIDKKKIAKLFEVK